MVVPSNVPRGTDLESRDAPPRLLPKIDTSTVKGKSYTCPWYSILFFSEGHAARHSTQNCVLPDNKHKFVSNCMLPPGSPQKPRPVGCPAVHVHWIIWGAHAGKTRTKLRAAQHPAGTCGTVAIHIRAAVESCGLPSNTESYLGCPSTSRRPTETASCPAGVQHSFLNTRKLQISHES